MTERSEAQSREPRSLPNTARDVMLTLLAIAAGCVDAASFLGLGQVLVAAMTGNTVLLGIALGQADAKAALRSTIALAGFIAGAFLGAATVARGPPEVTWSPAVTAALALELVVLAVLALCWHLLEGSTYLWMDYRYPLIVAAGVAMGIQSAAVHHLGVQDVATTYITGTLTNLAARLVDRLRTSRAARGAQPKEIGVPWLPAAVWLAYGSGAMFAGAAHLWWPWVVLPPVVTDLAGEVRWPSAALMLPIGIIAVVTLIAAIGHRRRLAPA